MALNLLEVCSIDKTRVLIRMVEATPTKPAVRAKVVGDGMPVVSVTAATNASPAVFSIGAGHFLAVNDYVRLANMGTWHQLNGIARVASVSGNDITLTAERGGVLTAVNGAQFPVYGGGGLICLGEKDVSSGDSRKWTTGGLLDKVKEVDNLMLTANRADRTEIFDLANWAVAGRTITGLYRRAFPYEHAQANYPGAQLGHQVTFEFHIILEVSVAFSSGNSYNITFPASTGISVQAYAFNDRTTRCHSIGVNQIGHRPTDESAVANLTIRLPQRAVAYGQVDLVTENSITTWELIDDTNATVWTAPSAPVLRKNGTDTETGANNGWYAQDPDGYGLPITSITASGTDTAINCVGHGLSVNDQFQIKDAEGGTQGGNANINTWGGALATLISGSSRAGYVVISVTDADNFIADRDISTLSPITYGGKLCKLIQLNSVGTYVHQMDFTAALSTLPEGTYRIRIPGMGVSDPLYITSGAWAKAAQISAQGIYHLNHGQACDGRFGYTRAPSAHSDYNNAQIFELNISAKFMSEQEGGPLLVPLPDPFAVSTRKLATKHFATPTMPATTTQLRLLSFSNVSHFSQHWQ